jgi:hypothetical protein
VRIQRIKKPVTAVAVVVDADVASLAVMSLAAMWRVLKAQRNLPKVQPIAAVAVA